jgi:hypothetical protein
MLEELKSPKYQIESLEDIKNAQTVLNLATVLSNRLVSSLIQSLPLTEQVELEMSPDRTETLNHFQILLTKELTENNQKLAQDLYEEFVTNPEINGTFGKLGGLSKQGLVLLRAMMDTSNFRKLLGLTDEQIQQL